jgi:hypothetical protein
MADETTTTWANLWREAKGPLVEAMKWKTVLLSEIKRDHSSRKWPGKQVTIPIFLSPQQGAGSMGETSQVNTPMIHDDAQTQIKSGIVSIAVSFSTQVLLQAKGDENVWAEVMPTKMSRAEDAFGRVINEMMSGAGNALLAPLGVQAASGGATQLLNVGTGANFYQLYPGRIVDIFVQATGLRTVAGNTMPVKITDYNQTNGTITVVNIDGSATSFATDATYGVYIQGSYGTAIQGLQPAVATTGLFQNLNKSTTDAWRGTDASPPGAPTTVDPGLGVFDAAERKVIGRSGRSPDFYLADPAVVDKFTQGLTVQARWAGEEGELKSGWTGVRYRNKLIVPDYDHPAKQATGIQLEDMTIYTLQEGPDWDDYTGNVLQRFQNRSLPVEAWLVWYLQLGFQACNALVKVGNLTPAT